jgi:hypothetical protein
LRQPVEVVSCYRTVAQQICADGFDSECPNLVYIVHHRFGALSRIPLAHAGRERLRVENYQVKEFALRVFMEGAQVFRGRIAPSLSRLRHQIGNINFQSPGLLNLFRDALPSTLGISGV